MKKIFLSLIIISSVLFTAVAQEDFDSNNPTSKRGETILPESGDIALGIDLAPFLQYFGNAMNGNTGNSAPSLNFLSQPTGENTIYLKYFLNSDAALRLSVELANENLNFKRYSRDDAAFLADPLSNNKVVDMYTYKNMGVVLGTGYEMRRGKGRLQGFYGGGLYFSYSKSSSDFQYGNAISDVNPVPTSNDFSGNILADGRVLNENNGQNIGGGLGLFLGVEYFVLPNISIGGELGWGYGGYKSSQSKYTYERWNGSEVENKLEIVSPGNSGSVIGVSNSSAGVYMMFHF